MRTPSTALFAVTLLGCDASIDRDVEHRLTISQGVYGQLTIRGDTMGSDGRSYWEDRTVALFDVEVPREEEPPEPVGSDVSGAQGFYEIEIDPGRYFIDVDATNTDEGFTNVGEATEVLVEHGLVRMDFAGGLGGGKWTLR